MHANDPCRLNFISWFPVKKREYNWLIRVGLNLEELK